MSCEQNDFFHDLMINIITSQTGVSEMANDDDDDEWRRFMVKTV